MQTIERAKIAKELESFCAKYQTYGEAAKALGVTLAQLSTARNKPDTVIPAKALAKLGYAYALVYVRKADAQAAKKPAAKKPAAKKVPAKKPAAKKPAAKKPSSGAKAAGSAPKPRAERQPSVSASVPRTPAAPPPPPEKVVNVTSAGAFD